MHLGPQNVFVFSQVAVCTLGPGLPYSSTPQPPATTVLLFLCSVSLNPTYKWDHAVSVFLPLWLTSLGRLPSVFTHVITNGRISFLLYSHFLCSFIWWQTHRLFPGLAFCQKCCNERACSDISLKWWFYFLQTHTQKWGCCIIW